MAVRKRNGAITGGTGAALLIGVSIGKVFAWGKLLPRPAGFRCSQPWACGSFSAKNFPAKAL